jgi:hypothetical protein
MHRSGSQCALKRPADTKPVTQCVASNAQSLRPLTLRKCLSVVREQFHAPGVSALFSWKCPADIAWFVSTVVVYPIDRMSWGWAFANCGSESLKTVSPFRTDRYPTCAVLAKVTIARIKAALFDRRPHIVQLCLALAVRSAMSPRLSEHAAAGLWSASCEALFVNVLNGPAFALTAPCFGCRVIGQQRQPPKSSTWNHRSAWHVTIMTRLIGNKARLVVGRAG